jgi:HAE1 family hydrophobic/amphiphilic exporter-1
MKNIYQNPLRVYLLLALLGLCGVWAGFHLPVSLYPNVSQPQITVGFSLEGLTPQEFRKEYGASLESSLKNLKRGGLKVEEVVAEYTSSNLQLDVKFNWNANPDEALRELNATVDSAAAAMPQNIREKKWIWSRAGRQKGFFLATVRSPQRSPSETYNLIEPVLKTKAASLEDGSVDFYNPNQEQILINLKQQRMASYGIFPADIKAAIENLLKESSGGKLRIGETHFSLIIPKQAQSFSNIEAAQIYSPQKGMVRLTEVADVSMGKSDTGFYKTSGVESVLIIGRLKDGGNIKKLSEDIKAMLQDARKQLPPDIAFDVLVDPSVSIRDSIRHVMNEVIIGAGLAVVILFLFIGSFRNVITAAIEIPLSIVLALILMKLFGMNINLISLGGLALSSGMNVDASVVVMENIFRKFEGVIPSQLTAHERTKRVIEAVKEVIAPLAASTISSLVVFVPIVFTSSLTYAILGDLAKAVVFSHAFSAFVALLLVPTVRLHLMKLAGPEAQAHKPPIEGFLLKMESIYERVLNAFTRSRASIFTASLLVVAILAAMAVLILPKLPTEIVGRPDSNMVGIWGGNPKFTTVSQAESLLNDIEKRMQSEFPAECAFTYTEAHSGNGGGVVFCSLANKRNMKKVKTKLEEIFKSTPEINYDVFQWSVAELPLPESYDAHVEFSGGTTEERARSASQLIDTLRGAFPHMNFHATSNIRADDVLSFAPRTDVWRSIQSASFSQTPQSLLGALRSYTNGDYISGFVQNEKSIPIKIQSPQFSFQDIEDVKALPVAVGEKILPLSALYSINATHLLVDAKYTNGEPSLAIRGQIPENFKSTASKDKEKIASIVEKWNRETNQNPQVGAKMGVPNKEEQEGIRELSVAAGLSVVLILITMFIQFGTLVEALLVLVAVPLALIGVLASLFLFQSTLSVNSVLGVILLNGISVANSILLVDYAKRLFKNGKHAHQAVVEAAKRRIRPILITSLTTILGMTPIALGLGEGGKVLQPLGIAVSGGMWVSTLFTLFMVPALHGLYLKHLEKKSAQAKEPCP